MPFSIATWNINSVRLRMPLVERLLLERAPDVLCLQETKCPDDLFPFDRFHALGYRHVEIHGQKGYHGVATVSRRPIEVVERRRFCEIADSRHLSVRVEAGSRSILIHNFYVPAGGDEPDPEINPKFKHKLGFLDELKRWFCEPGFQSGQLICGDFNVAPHENDVWSHKQLLKVVSHTPVETAALDGLLTGGHGWVDLVRKHVPYDQKLYSWWSYRSPNWELSDRGRRLDHIWSTQDIAARSTAAEILKPVRGWGSKPSDHVPVLVRF